MISMRVGIVRTFKFVVYGILIVDVSLKMNLIVLVLSDDSESIN